MVRRWWRWTWRGWIAGIFGVVLSSILVVLAMQVSGTDFLEELGKTEFRWDGLGSYLRLGFHLSCVLPAAYVGASLELSALRADFPHLPERRWILLSVAALAVTGAIDVVFLDALKASGEALIPYIVVYEGLDSMAIAWVLWHFALKDQAAGEGVWLAFNGAAGLLSNAVLGFVTGFTPDPESIVVILTFIGAPFLAVAVSGVAAAMIRPRQHGLEQVFA